MLIFQPGEENFHENQNISDIDCGFGALRSVPGVNSD
jgi:hypothetical protein